MGYGAIVVWETMGTALLVLLGTGVVANAVLKNTNGNNGGTLFINIGWGFAVFTGASVANPSGAHLNPAVTLGLAIARKVSWDKVPFYFAGEMAGAIIGAMLCWATYKLQFDRHDEPQNTLGVFSTAPRIPGGIDVRHLHAARATVERSRDERGVVVLHADDGAVAGDLGGAHHVLDVFPAGRTVFSVEEDAVEIHVAQQLDQSGGACH